MAVGIELMVRAAQAVLQEPLGHVGLGEELGDGRDLATRLHLAPAPQLGIDARLGLLLIELIRPANGIRVPKHPVQPVPLRPLSTCLRLSTPPTTSHTPHQRHRARPQRSVGVVQVEEAGQAAGLDAAGVFDHGPPAGVRAAGALRRSVTQDEEGFGDAIVGRVGA